VFSQVLREIEQWRLRIYRYSVPWASEGFFPGGDNSGFLQGVAQGFFPGGDQP